MRYDKVRDHFKDAHDSIVMVIYDVWDMPGSRNRAQVRTEYMDIEDAVKEFGDCIFTGWYTEKWNATRQRWIATMWIGADEKHRIDPVLYERWK